MTFQGSIIDHLVDPYGVSMSHRFADILPACDCLAPYLTNLDKDQRTNFTVGAKHRTRDAYFTLPAVLQNRPIKVIIRQIFLLQICRHKH